MHSEYTKSHWILHIEWVNWMVWNYISTELFKNIKKQQLNRKISKRHFAEDKTCVCDTRYLRRCSASFLISPMLIKTTVGYHHVLTWFAKIFNSGNTASPHVEEVEVGGGAHPLAEGVWIGTIALENKLALFLEGWRCKYLWPNNSTPKYLSKEILPVVYWDHIQE